MVQSIVRGDTVTCRRGGKEVHAADVAKAVEILLTAPVEQVSGEAFNCYDMYISDFDVANLAKQLAESNSEIEGKQTAPKNQIRTEKLWRLGMEFGGPTLLRQTIEQLVSSVRIAG